MKKIITALALAGALIIPATASASPVYECGDVPTYNVVNLTTRNPHAHSRREACYAARIFLSAWNSGSNFSGMQTRYGVVGGRKDIRVTSRRQPGWVVHFQQPNDLYND